MRKHSMTLAALLIAVIVGRAAATDLPPDREKFHLFLLVGQSNMAGRGKVTDEDRKPIPGVFMLTKSGEWKPAVAPLHFDKKIAGVGIGREFAKEIAKTEKDAVIGLIPCAVGGSGLLLKI